MGILLANVLGFVKVEGYVAALALPGRIYLALKHGLAAGAGNGIVFGGGMHYRQK